MEQWEYKTLKLSTGGFFGGKVDEEELEDELNRFGRDGWELASSFDTSQAQGASREIIIMFKRRKG
ncbi:DUF4177 domain-containing protein [Paenibacillus endoradicis]|uniref:DUF4177 domain-containing protein n=1 Tax=Paenibacillus endoradicis TaxID=2972487 RepID=UPI002159733C|nr:DUF4177 domain-containing protein [Paenibacillus endoradicis]MCR8657383.1 DUF4177 domain-containing protein [Paenibacillus endoradicis]